MLSGICFADAFYLGSGVRGNPLSDTWGGATNGIVLGIIFFIHGLSTGPRRADVVLSACVFAGFGLALDHGLLERVQSALERPTRPRPYHLVSRRVDREAAEKGTAPSL